MKPYWKVVQGRAFNMNRFCEVEVKGNNEIVLWEGKDSSTTLSFSNKEARDLTFKYLLKYSIESPFPWVAKNKEKL